MGETWKGPMYTLPAFGFRTGSESRRSSWGIAQGSPFWRAAWVGYGQLSGRDSGLDASSQHPRSLGQPRTVKRSQSGSLLPAQARQSAGRKRQADLTHRRANCPWKGNPCTPPPLPASVRSLALQISQLTDLPPASAPAHTSLAEFW